MLIALDPMVFRLFEDFGIHWYGLIYILTLFLSYIFLKWLTVRQKMGVTADLVWSLLMSLMLGAFLGGRLGFCIFYDPSLFLKFRDVLPFWGVLAVFDGGLSLHGAMFGVWLSLGLFSWRHRLSLPYLLDLAAITAALQIGFMRVGNFINGEILGRVCDSENPYCVRFSEEISSWPDLHPEKLRTLDEAVLKTPSVSFANWSESVKSLVADKSGVVRDTTHEMVGKILHEAQAGNLIVQQDLAKVLQLRYPVQLQGALFEGFFIFLILLILWYRPQRSGVISGLFLTLYSAARFFVEYYREPDWQLGYLVFGLTMGQILSLLFFGLGLWFLSFYGRKDAVARPGWGLGAHVRLHRR
jgi:phosphatidylglycerol:prolipoprotein diacylglycerol transferase